jgi:hypothetical protein
MSVTASPASAAADPPRRRTASAAAVCPGDYAGCATRLAARFNPPALAIEYRVVPDSHRLLHVMDLAPLLRRGLGPTAAVDRLISSPDWPLSPMRVSRRQMERLYGYVREQWRPEPDSDQRAAPAPERRRPARVAQSIQSVESEPGPALPLPRAPPTTPNTVLVASPVPADGLLGQANLSEEPGACGPANELPVRPRYRVSRNQRARAVRRYKGQDNGAHLRLSDSSGATTRMRLAEDSEDEFGCAGRRQLTPEDGEVYDGFL